MRQLGFKKDWRNGWKGNAAAIMPQFLRKSFRKGTLLRSVSWKVPGWDCRAMQLVTPMPGRLRISNTSYRQTAWAIWNEFLTALAAGVPQKRRFAKCCTVITTT